MEATSESPDFIVSYKLFKSIGLTKGSSPWRLIIKSESRLSRISNILAVPFLCNLSVRKHSTPKEST